MLPIRTVLHPTDCSERSDLAFRLACSLARDYGARLLALHVIPPSPASAEGVVVGEPEGYEELLRESLHALKPRDGTVPVEYLLIRGDPVAEIVGVAQDRGADVIVMGTHGRTGLGRFLMGSVAEQVMRNAPCPVVTVKGTLPQREAPREADRVAETTKA